MADVSAARAEARPAAHAQKWAILGAFVSTVLMLASTVAFAQAVSPSQVTPPTLRPPPSNQAPSFNPEESGQQERAHTLSMSVQVRHVIVTNGLAALADDTQRLLEPYENRRVTGDEIFTLAHALEQAYARHGYVLVRVVVPPQRIANGDVLRLDVVDGFIEEVNVEAVPRRLQALVLRRLRALVGQHHILLSKIERHLLIAGNLAGLTLKSALAPGTMQGGTRLIVGGVYREIDGTVSLDNRLDRALGPWELDGSVSVNSLLSLGEQLYADVLSSDPQQLVHRTPALEVYGGGAVMPVGNAGVSLNPEYTHSATRTAAVPGVPETVGVFDRVALRSSIGLRWRRRQVLKLDLTAEALNQRLETPEFNTDLYHDQYRVVRVGLDDDALSMRGTHLVADATVSRGLGGRNPAVGAAGVPLSRLDSSPDFNKLNFSAQLSQPLGGTWRLDLVGLGQASFGSAMMRSEQFSLDGIDALSAFAAGSLTVDQGATLRAEVGRPVFSWTSIGTVISPYLLAADGVGELLRPTAVETRWLHASTYGAGMRSSIVSRAAPAADIALEVAHQEAHLPGIHENWRVNLVAGLRF